MIMPEDTETAQHNVEVLFMQSRDFTRKAHDE